MGCPFRTVVILQDGDWWVGWIAEIPGVNAQECAREESLETLAGVLREAALDMNRRDALAHVGGRYEEVVVSL